MLVAAPPRYPAPEWFGLRSEEEKMSTIALSHKAAKLMKLCCLEGYKRLNDLLRASVTDNIRTTFLGGRVVMTAGVADLSLGVKAQVVLKVQSFADFNANNDPYGEHDFGSFEVAGETFFWKIDCYDSLCEFGSEDPADPE